MTKILQAFFTSLFCIHFIGNCLGQQDDSLQKINRRKLTNEIFRKDTIRIDIIQSGCFHHNEINLWLIKNNRKYKLEGSGGYYNSHIENHLSVSRVRSCRNLIKRCFNIKRGGCTSSYRINVVSGNKSVSFIDRRCSDSSQLDDKILKRLKVYKEFNKE